VSHDFKTGPDWWQPGEGSHNDSDGVAGCEIRHVHAHVGDQVFYTPEEFVAAYPDGMPDPVVPEPDDTGGWGDPNSDPLGDIKKWVSVGFASGGVVTPADPHNTHVHVGLGPPPPGASPITTLPGGVRPARSYHSPGGKAIDINVTPDPNIQPGDFITINKDGKAEKYKVGGSSFAPTGIVLNMDPVRPTDDDEMLAARMNLNRTITVNFQIPGS
jgi:hypothetical protein